MLQNISLIVCIKKATKCVMIFPSQNDLNGALDVGVCKIMFLLNCLNTLILLLNKFVIILLNHQENHIFYAIKMLHYYYFCHIYLPNISYHIKRLMCTELQYTQLLLRCVFSVYFVIEWYWYKLAITKYTNFTRVCL